MDYTYVIASVQHADDESPFDAIDGEPVREQPSAHIARADQLGPGTQ